MSSPGPEGVARGEDALSLLENPQTRAQFIDELMELELFLCQRLSEMSEEADVVAMSQFQLAPSVIQAQTRERVEGMLGTLRSLLDRLTNVRMQHLFMIQASPRYVERVSEVLRQKLKQADILVLKRGTLAERRQEALEEQGKLEPRIDLLAVRTRELQRLVMHRAAGGRVGGAGLGQSAGHGWGLGLGGWGYTTQTGPRLYHGAYVIEADIAKRYNNRPVNLMGVNI
ncbi:hypothetical protein JZ751_008074 [Albula glossodonta]|uniref:Uncharacterized protein n=1 Tax=Albula glossodonta TaxID=121402 RepID=A0A8T2P1P1_9TELE|nr:hypothetical protein JZ751_008074 [Albula glossodonta]